MRQDLGLASISEARASACVSIYSRMFVSFPFRTVISVARAAPSARTGKHDLRLGPLYGGTSLPLIHLHAIFANGHFGGGKQPTIMHSYRGLFAHSVLRPSGVRRPPDDNSRQASLI
jgi:hypothetical protein